MSNPGQHPSSSCLPVRCWQVLSSSRCATSLQTALPPYNRTASAVWISTVRSQRRQEMRRMWRGISERRRCRSCVPVAWARGSLNTDSQYSAGRGAFGTATEGLGLRAASAASFSICFGVGMRQLGRSELEHKENISRVRSSPGREKIILWGGSPCRNQAGPFVLNPASVLEFHRHGPPR